MNLKKPFIFKALLLSIALEAGQVYAQTASEITPSEFNPPLQRLNGAVVFDGGTGTEAPPGSETIGISLSGVEVRDGLPQLKSSEDALVQQLTRGRIPVSELFEATAELEAAYARAGFVLSRVVLPQQTLRDGGRLQIVVVNGFIEEIETDDVPDQTRNRTEKLTDPLIGRPGLTQRELERQLLLAGDAPGTALRSVLNSGEEPGAAVIKLAPTFQPITGFVGFGNPTSPSLGEFTLNSGIEFNSPFRYGETFYFRASGSPSGFASDEPQNRVLAAGAIVPLGFTGLSFNVEVTSSRTNPDALDGAIPSEFDRLSFRLNYPFVRSRDLNISGQIALDLQEDQQGDPDALIYRDELTVLRLGGSSTIFHEDEAVTFLGLTLSQGLDTFGARSAADAAASGTPLSTSGADAVFTKLSGSLSHQRQLTEKLALVVDGRFQTSLGDPLVTSEQFTLVGPQELSAFDSGALRGDSGWVLRSELSTTVPTSVAGFSVLMRPYGFVSYGEATLAEPTAVEQEKTTASAIGIGVDIFGQSDSSFRSSNVRIEIGRGDRDDGEEDDTRLGISAGFRF